MSNSSSRSWRYDVFPSFRGEDVRNNFLSHLLKEFECKGIVTFRDDHIQRSQQIGPELVQAIRESKISVILFSENYASSSWCLDELVMILKCREELGLKVMPIFYKVDPSDVRKQNGNFGIGFSKTCDKKSEEQQQSWREALTVAASIVGDHLQDQVSEADMITKIVMDVVNKLNETPSRDFSDLVGINAHIEKMNSFLCLGSEEVRIVGIWGPAGIGKTTIARVLYDQLHKRFKLSIFMENVRECYNGATLDDYGIKLRLQQNLLSRILDQNGLRIHHLGTVEERLQDQKVLIILDDVDTIEQLQALANETRWFGKESRIIVTTRNKQLLISHSINYIYKVAFPSTKEALAIFFQHAFKERSPSEDLKALAVEVANLAGHLPLGLRVLGSYMSGKSKDEWKVSLPTLRTRLDGEIKKVLKVGYEGLHEDEKYIFLHIACLFNGHEENYLKQMVVANNDSDVSFGLKVLADRSLIQVYGNGRIEMHSLLQQLGREVVRHQSYDPGQRQFLINAREISGVLSNNTGTGMVLGISVDMCDIKEEIYISEKAFEHMRNLLYIRFYWSNVGDNNNKMSLAEGLTYLPQLRLLHWDSYPLMFLPSPFRTECLVKLNMSHSKLKRLWGDEIQPLRSLKFMDLSYSYNLEAIPNLLKATNLEDLDLSCCESLVELPSSIKNLQKLSRLEMSGCIRLRTIPTDINLASLSHLSFKHCKRLETFPEISENVKILKIRSTAISDVSLSVRRWEKIEEICMENTKVRRIHSVPYKLDRLCLRSNSELLSIPDDIKYLRWLSMIDISHCTKIASLPELPYSLRALTAINCESLQILSGCYFRFYESVILNFTNCLELNLEARKSVLQPVYRKVILPGTEVPRYFIHLSHGMSVTIYPDETHIPNFSCFKACVVIASGGWLNRCEISIHTDERIFSTPIHKFTTFMSFQPDFTQDHLCMFEFVFPRDCLEALHSAKLWRFDFNCYPCTVLKCAIQLLETPSLTAAQNKRRIKSLKRSRQKYET